MGSSPGESDNRNVSPGRSESGESDGFQSTFGSTPPGPKVECVDAKWGDTGALFGARLQQTDPGPQERVECQAAMEKSVKRYRPIFTVKSR